MDPMMCPHCEIEIPTFADGTYNHGCKNETGDPGSSAFFYVHSDGKTPDERDAEKRREEKDKEETEAMQHSKIEYFCTKCEKIVIVDATNVYRSALDDHGLKVLISHEGDPFEHQVTSIMDIATESPHPRLNGGEPKVATGNDFVDSFMSAAPDFIKTMKSSMGIPTSPPKPESTEPESTERETDHWDIIPCSDLKITSI